MPVPKSQTEEAATRKGLNRWLANALGEVSQVSMELLPAGFCASIDLSTDPAANGAFEDTSTIAAVNRLTAAVVTCPKPTIAAVKSPAVGFAVSLALSCDLVLAGESAYFILAFTRIGLMPDGGSIALIAASIGRTRALRMALLAERLVAHQALGAGLLSAVYADAVFDHGTAAIAGWLASGPMLTFAATKRAINAATIPRLDAMLTNELRSQAVLLTSPDFDEGCTAFREKRPPMFTGRATS